MAINTNDSTNRNSMQDRYNMFASQLITNLIASLNVIDKFQNDLRISAMNPGYETLASKIVKANKNLILLIEEVKFKLFVELCQIETNTKLLNEMYERIEQIELKIELETRAIQNEADKKEIEIRNKISEEFRDLKQLIDQRIFELKSLISKIKINIQSLSERINSLTIEVLSQENSLRQLISDNLEPTTPMEPITFQLPAFLHDNNHYQANSFHLTGVNLKELFIDEVINRSDLHNKVSIDSFVTKIKNDIIDSHLKNMTLTPEEISIYKNDFDTLNKTKIEDVKQIVNGFNIIYENEAIVSKVDNYFNAKNDLQNLKHELDYQTILLTNTQSTLDVMNNIRGKLDEKNLSDTSTLEITSLLASTSAFTNSSDMLSLISSNPTTLSSQINLNELMTPINIASDLSSLNLADINLDSLTTNIPSFESLSKNVSSTSSMLMQLTDNSANTSDYSNEVASKTEKPTPPETSYRPGLFGQSAQKHQMEQKKTTITPEPADELKNKK